MDDTSKRTGWLKVGRRASVTIHMTDPNEIELENHDRMMVDDSTGISYLLREGDGRTIVMLHGIGSNAASFYPLFGALDEDALILAWNAPGYLGSSPLAAEWPTADDYAEALLRFVDGLKVDSMILLGHSLGCLVAGAFVARNPERISHLVLSSPALGYRVPVGDSLPEKVGSRLSDIDRLGVETFAESRSRRLIHDPDGRPDLVEAVRREMARLNPEGYAQAVRMLASGDLEAQMESIPVKPGFIIGACDQVTPVAQTMQAATAWQHYHGERPVIEEIAGAGHAVYLEKPVQFLTSFRALTGPSHLQ